MKELCKTLIIMLGSLWLATLVYPEFLLTEDVVEIQDKGEEVLEGLSINIEKLYTMIQERDPAVEFDLGIVEILNNR